MPDGVCATCGACGSCGATEPQNGGQGGQKGKMTKKKAAQLVVVAQSLKEKGVKGEIKK